MNRHRYKKPGNRFSTIKVKQTPHKVEHSYGVLPSPNVLESYEEIAPGTVKTIMSMAEREQEHRHKLETQHVKSIAYSQRLGQILVFILSIIIIYVSVAFSLEGHTAYAISLVLGGFGFLATLILGCQYFKKNNNKTNT